jgi:hypothetical protein
MLMPPSSFATLLSAGSNAACALGAEGYRRSVDKVIELRFFGGLSVEETAEVLRISAQSVMRDWKMARAWLMAEIAH